ncbi:class I SAM-dependent methyltransferase [Paenibacillus sp. 2TAB23]|uniref:class I SAM-dependent methyltransferase n=1 Tax=Paenibacillus sp. 2TAB23 TaxID=3233004 RepID=UPI003F991B9B
MHNIFLKDLLKSAEQVTISQDGLLIENKYAGTYADLPEQEEINLIKELQQKKWEEVVAQRYFKKQPWLYRIITDPGRSQFLDIINVKPGGLYLDVGSGWGQVAIPLARYGKSIAFDLTKNRLDILLEIAKQEKVNLSRIQGNFLTFPFNEEIFDLIVFNGSLEWIASGRAENESIKECQINALSKAASLLTNDGIIYIGIENSLGAKYIMGTHDDHTSMSHLMYLSEKFANEKYNAIRNKSIPAKTWSLSEYEQLFQDAGLSIERVYACYPDYKLIRVMVQLEDVNSYLLKNSHQVLEYDGSNGHGIEYQNELRHLYNTLALNNVAQYFCPSYGFVLKKKG